MFYLTTAQICNNVYTHLLSIIYSFQTNRIIKLSYTSSMCFTRSHSNVGYMGPPFFFFFRAKKRAFAASTSDDVFRLFPASSSALFVRLRRASAFNSSVASADNFPFVLNARICTFRSFGRSRFTHAYLIGVIQCM
eukprot:m.218706 g.218706  ORF g.218706 m.218706 type:complete len:136 (+) comp13817_c0_seq7:3894-4301(+)